MSQRPKRKATANKSYVDSASEPFLELAASQSSSNTLVKSLLSSSRASTVANAGSGAPNGRAAANGTNQKSPRKRAAPANERAEADYPLGATNKRLSSALPPAPGAALGSRIVPYNWQPPATPMAEFSFKLDLTEATVNTKLQTLLCPRHAALPGPLREEYEYKHIQSLISSQLGTEPEPVGTRRKAQKACFQIRKGDFIYMVSEPPGEPYYIGCVKGFKRKDEQAPETEKEVESAAGYMFQIQWFYRPRDILKHTVDLRLLFASMHSDTCPLQSFRGLLTVLHKLDVEMFYQPPKDQLRWSTAVEFYSSFPNCFYFDKLYDRYILKFYDIVKTLSLLPYIDNAANCSRNYILALNKRFEFVLMESTRTKPFLNNFTSKLSTHCDVCAEWCGTSDSVTCAGCEKHFHMLCLDPPLLRKPSRGFSWSCALCTKKHELEHQSKQMLMLSHDNRSSNADALLLAVAPIAPLAQVAEPKKALENFLPKYEQMAINYLTKDALVSVLQRRVLEEWNIRYLGIHARLEEAVDLLDRSYYPRASTSLGQRYQATNIPEFEGHPIVYYDPEKSVSDKSKKKAPKRPVKKKPESEEVKELPIPEEYKGTPPKEFPQWLQPRPKGYIERGVDDGEGDTCTLMWKPLAGDLGDGFASLDAFVASQNHVAEKLGLHPNSPNFVDGILKAYIDCAGDVGKAAGTVAAFTRANLREPTFSKEEVKRFEAGVKKFGSELYPIAKEVRTQSPSMVVRFYYVWKKTERGHAIWGNFPGRKKKASKAAEMKIKPPVDDYADSDDDSSYENEKIISRKKAFQCKHCRTYVSQRWFKTTGFDGTTVLGESAEAEDLDSACVIALCYRCARIWRRYAVYWEDPLEVEKKVGKGSGGYRKKVESELVADADMILFQSRQEGFALSYDLGRVHPVSSVLDLMDQPRITNEQPMSSEKDAVLEKDAVDQKPVKTQKSRKLASTPTELPDSKSPVVADSKKTPKGGLEKVVKKRKVETKATDEPAKAERPKKRQSQPKPETSAKAKRRKASPETKAKENGKVKTEEGIVQLETPEVIEKIDSQEKNTDTTILADPIFNGNYRGQAQEIILDASEGKELASLGGGDLARSMVDLKSRQLLDLKLLIPDGQALPLVKIDVPFPVDARNCSVCLELDNLGAAIQEMLICSSCGVNVHGSCAGIAISGKPRPVLQWLCDACINEMGPKFSTERSCSICYARFTDTELALLGNELARPDFVIPIVETKKWCHMVCALFCHESVSFRHLVTPGFIPKELLSTTQTKSLGLVVESASRVHVENFDKQCGICGCNGGGLVSCDQCDVGEVYHVTCSQDTPRFKLGFRLMPQKTAKQNNTTFVRESQGRLMPVLVCPKHEQGEVFGIREHGKRSATGEPRPLIQLFIEDLMKNITKVNGPQLRAQNYISMISNLQNKLSGESSAVAAPQAKETVSCCECKIMSSPKWWPAQNKKEDYIGGVGLDETRRPLAAERPAFKCQKCHVRGSSGGAADAPLEGDKFLAQLNRRLEGNQYGVRDLYDRIECVPYELSHKLSDRIQLSNILR